MRKLWLRKPRIGGGGWRGTQKNKGVTTQSPPFGTAEAGVLVGPPDSTWVDQLQVGHVAALVVLQL